MTCNCNSVWPELIFTSHIQACLLSALVPNYIVEWEKKKSIKIKKPFELSQI